MNYIDFIKEYENLIKFDIMLLDNYVTVIDIFAFIMVINFICHSYISKGHLEKVSIFYFFELRFPKLNFNGEKIYK